MKKLLALFAVVASSGLSFADEHTTSPVNLGVDFAMPYILTANNNSVNERGNFNMGLDGRYWMNDNLNVGGRFAFDLEERTGTERAVVFAPGVQYRWMTNEAFNPYVRGDLPVTFNGAAGADQDMGISGGLGMAWNLGQAIGADHLLVRYDFNLAYNFGLGDAVNTLGIEFFKIGVDYKF